VTSGGTPPDAGVEPEVDAGGSNPGDPDAGGSNPGDPDGGGGNPGDPDGGGSGDSDAGVQNKSDDGCDCRVAGADRSPFPGALLGVVGFLLVASLRRRARRR
jgi:MYXO-CTERM domain-containing protein